MGVAGISARHAHAGQCSPVLGMGAYLVMKNEMTTPIS